MDALADQSADLGAVQLFANINPAALGNAYLFLLISLVLSIVFFVAARMNLVVTPNHHAKNYGLYVLMVVVALAIAATLENRIVSWAEPAIGYAFFPHLFILAAIHFWIYQEQQPWLITLGAASVIGSILVAIPVALSTSNVQLVHWVAAGLLIALIAYLSYYAIATKRGFIKARSIYVDSNETIIHKVHQRPWLGLPQWVFLTVASIALATLNASAGTGGIAAVTAVAVFIQSVILLGMTSVVCAIPAGVYWLAHRHWMPELTRFVWLVWLVVGFAFSYRNFLSGISAF